MRVVGVDPGFDRLGIAVLERSPRGGESVLHSSCFVTDRALSFPERLGCIADEIESVFRAHEPGALAIETLFFNTNQKTAVDVASVRGLILALAATHRIAVSEYSPPQVKIAVTGYGRSTKAQVMAMVPRLLALPHTPAHDDEYDALAVALTHLASARRQF